MGSSVAFPSDTTYDTIPYPSRPFAQTHPSHLGAIANLFNLNVPSPTECRVLEIGCGQGGNILPMAEQLPQSEFVGVDLARLQIEEAQRIVSALQLTNIRFVHGDISKLPDLGIFDYIICHGVYSWVPPTVQESILATCAKSLTSNGISYISYNTHPGWYLRGVIRDLMRYRVAGLDIPRERIREARSVLNLLAEYSTPQTPFGQLLRAESAELQRHVDEYLFHEHLEANNDPVFFHEFVNRARRHGFQYLGEAEVATMWTGHMPSHLTAKLEGLSKDLTQMEQYMDFLRGRTFRQTLLCRETQSIDREMRPATLSKLYISSDLRPNATSFNVRDRSQVVFKSRFSDRQVTLEDPAVKAAAAVLARTFPGSIGFAALLNEVFTILGTPLVVSTEARDKAASDLGKSILRLYLSSHIDLLTSPIPCVSKAGSFPLASKLARLQAAEGYSELSNLRHSVMRVDDVTRRLLPFMDGTRSHSMLLDILRDMLKDGVITMARGHERPDPEGGATVLSRHLEFVLMQAERSALLVA
jgi:methyltransferase-like protein/2-polyprenyl-3-methyl-5-hydroxy-6-metoxy-1,4-benzoquinol methylase